MIYLLFALGMVLLVCGADVLVTGASKLALAANISPLVVGLTVVAFGTSSPELAVAIQSTFAGQADLALGNVIGSNIANVLLILGIAASITPLVVAQQLVRLDVPLIVGMSLLVLWMGSDNLLSRLDGWILFALGLAYTIYLVRYSRKNDATPVSAHDGATGGKVLLKNLLFVAVGLAMLIVGARWLVAGAIEVADFLGISKLVTGLTIVAIGTSLPEIATSVLASRRGEGDIAVGSVVGSNLYNIVFVLGLGAGLSPAGINVSTAALHFDLPIMIAVAVACLPIFFSDYRISRFEGAVFLGYYAAYTLYIVMNSTGHELTEPFGSVMLLIVMPITLMTICILTYRSIKLAK